MSALSQYKTKQGQEILEYLRTTQGNHVTAQDVVAYFQGQEKPIGVATVYRQLEKLVEGGRVSKHFLDKVASYEYVDREHSCKQPQCFHCKCQGCGTLIHLQCDALEGLQAHMYQGHGFVLDPIRTVFYGTCCNCS